MVFWWFYRSTPHSVSHHDYNHSLWGNDNNNINNNNVILIILILLIIIIIIIIIIITTYKSVYFLSLFLDQRTIIYIIMPDLEFVLLKKKMFKNFCCVQHTCVAGCAWNGRYIYSMIPLGNWRSFMRMSWPWWRLYVPCITCIPGGISYPGDWGLCCCCVPSHSFCKHFFLIHLIIPFGKFGPPCLASVRLQQS